MDGQGENTTMEDKKIEREAPPTGEISGVTDAAPARKKRRRRRRKKPAAPPAGAVSEAAKAAGAGTSDNAPPAGHAPSAVEETAEPGKPSAAKEAEPADKPTDPPAGDDAAEAPSSAESEPVPAADAPEPPDVAPEPPAEEPDEAGAPAQTENPAAQADKPAAPEQPAPAAEAEEAVPLQQTEEQRRRTAEMTRTVQLSIEKLMSALPPDPGPEEPETPEDEEAETAAPTVGQRVLSGIWGLCKWLLLVIAFVAVVAGVGIGWLYNGATRDMLPEVSASFAGQTLETAAYDWQVPVVGDWFKRSYTEHLAREPQQLSEIQTASAALSIQADNCSSWLTIQNAAGDTVFDGAGEEFVTFEFTENGAYTAELVVYRTETGLAHEAGVSGSQTYRFAFTVNLRPSFRLNTSTVRQGGVAVVRVTGVADTPKLTTELTATPFYQGKTGWIAYLPIEVDRATGDYTLHLEAGGFTQDYTLTVRQTTATVRDYAWRGELATPYLGLADTPAKVEALLSVADEEMAWAEGGFVQPFPATIEVTLPYGTTEYVGRTVAQRKAGTGSGRTATNAVISGERGGALIAPANGRVLLAEDLGGTAGNTIVIEHGAGVKSIFYNLRALQVSAGDTVGIGEQIATTNAVTIGEVRVGAVPVDPLSIWRGLCDAMRYY